MRIIITGANGLLGQALWEVLSNQHELLALDLQKPQFANEKNWRSLNITNADNVYEVITKINPDLVIHTAAMTNVDTCERNPEEAFRVNALGTRNVALACQRFDTSLLYISTDHVFNGRKRTPYCEYDKTEPLNVYGLSKLWGERFVQTLLNKFYIVRTAWLFGSARENFVSRILKAAHTGSEIPIVTNMTGSTTYALDLAKAIALLIQKSFFGTFHLSNNNCCSRLEIAQWIARRFKTKHPIHIRKLTQQKLKLAAQRPVFASLDNFHWRLSGLPRLRSWQDAIADYIKEKKL